MECKWSCWCCRWLLEMGFSFLWCKYAFERRSWWTHSSSHLCWNQRYRNWSRSLRSIPANLPSVSLQRLWNGNKCSLSSTHAALNYCVFLVRSSAADYPHVSQQVKQLDEDSATALAEVTAAKSIMGRVLWAWESYSDCLSSLQAWLEQNSIRLSQGHRAEVLATLQPLNLM